MINKTKINPYKTDALIDALTSIWEASVLTSTIAQLNMLVDGIIVSQTVGAMLFLPFGRF